MSDITVKSSNLRRPAYQVPWVRLAPWLYTIGLFVIWELAVRVSGISHTILPAPTRIAGKPGATTDGWASTPSTVALIRPW